MCFHCPNAVDELHVEAAMIPFVTFLRAEQIPASINTGIALRMVARLSQSQQFHDCQSPAEQQTAIEATFVQSADYAAEYPEVTRDSIDKVEVHGVFNALLSALREYDIDLTNERGCGLLVLSELMFRSPAVPPTSEMIDDALRSTVFAFNAEKAFAQNGGSSLLN